MPAPESEAAGAADTAGKPRGQNREARKGEAAVRASWGRRHRGASGRGRGPRGFPGHTPGKGVSRPNSAAPFPGRRTGDVRGSGRLRSREFVSRHKKRHRGRLQELLAAIKNFQRPVELPSGAFPEATAGRTGRVGTSQSVGRQQKAECSEAASSRTAGRAAWPSAQVCCAHSMLASKCDRRRCESCPAGRRQVVSSCRLANDVSCKTTETCFLRKSSAVRFHDSGTTGIVCVSSATHDPRHAA